MESLFDECVNDITEEYRRLGHSMGWRFLTSSRRSLFTSPQVALITANPGGDHQPKDHGTSSCESGCAYIVERWKGQPAGEENLQRQVRMLFSAISRISRDSKGGDALLNTSLSGYFVPFRSPRFSMLHNPRASIAFGSILWSKVFSMVGPRLVLTIDPHAFKGITKLTKASGGALCQSKSFATGWGDYTADVCHFQFNGIARTVVRLPHLSQYKLFSRPECIPKVEAMLRYAING